MARNRMRFAFLATFSLALAGTVGQATAGLIVEPTGNTTVEGDSQFGLGGNLTFQVVFNQSLLSGLPNNAEITGISFRLTSGQATGPAAAAGISATNFNVWIGKSTAVAGSLSQTFATNQDDDTVQVRSGSLNFAQNSFPGGSTPNSFGPTITFSTPYTYTGGNLLLTISTQGLSSTLVVDAATNVAGVQQIQANSYNAATAPFVNKLYTPVIMFSYNEARTNTAVPEPTTLVSMLTGVGLIGVGSIVRRQRSSI